MEPFLRLTRQDLERVIGGSLAYAIEAHAHFGAAIVIDDVASESLQPVKQRALADLCRAKFLSPGIS
jgi:hypothetical protein